MMSGSRGRNMGEDSDSDEAILREVNLRSRELFGDDNGLCMASKLALEQIDRDRADAQHAADAAMASLLADLELEGADKAAVFEGYVVYRRYLVFEVSRTGW